MNKMNYNHSIKCSVKDCAHHAEGEDYCALSQILVDSHDNNPSNPESTDCASFEPKS